MATIAMPTVDFAGRVAPANRLAAVLVQRGHRVLTWAPRRWRLAVEGSGAEYREHETVAGMRPRDSSIEFAAMLATACDSCVDTLIEELAALGADLVVHDAHALWGRVAAEFLGLPRIVINPMIPRSVGASAPPRPGRDRERATGPPAARPTDSHALELERCRLAIGRRWGVELGDDHETNMSPGEVTVTFTTPEMLGDWKPPADWWLAGPLMDEVAEERSSSGREFIYVSLGTLFVSAAALAPVIEALSCVDADVVIGLAHSVVAAAELGPLPQHIAVEPDADQRRLLSRASLHITHGGLNSVHESLIAGVPMVCLPQGADQFAWADRVRTLGAGEVVEPRARAISQGVERVRRDPVYGRRAAELGRRLRAYPGEDVVVAALSAAGIRSH